MLNNLKAYIGLFIAAIVGVFAALFKMRGAKIKSLKTDNESLKTNIDKQSSVIEAQQREIKIRETVNEIMSERPDVNAAAARLRSRAKNNRARSK